MKPIPVEAMPVVEVIRRDVERPGELPVPRDPEGLLRWDGEEDGSCRCPMGLHPKARNDQPISSWGFIGKMGWEQGAILKFAYWWDRLEEGEAKEAVTAVWGEA